MYAGSPGGSREESFKDFLGRWFDQADVIDLRELSVKAAQPYDVVIADWRSRYGKDGYPDSMEGAGVQLPANFVKPVLMISAVGGELVRRQAKIGWL